MSYFPFFVEIGQKRCLVVGGGTVAFRKIEKLLPFGVEITVVSPSFLCGNRADRGHLPHPQRISGRGCRGYELCHRRNRLRGC